jgi:hypothetical protein
MIRIGKRVDSRANKKTGKPAFDPTRLFLKLKFFTMAFIK